MHNSHIVANIYVEADALRVLHRVVSEAHNTWPGGDANEQACLLQMKNQLYAALMDHLFHSGSI